MVEQYREIFYEGPEALEQFDPLDKKTLTIEGRFHHGVISAEGLLEGSRALNLSSLPRRTALITMSGTGIVFRVETAKTGAARIVIMGKIKPGQSQDAEKFARRNRKTFPL